MSIAHAHTHVHTHTRAHAQAHTSWKLSTKFYEPQSIKPAHLPGITNSHFPGLTMI